ALNFPGRVVDIASNFWNFVASILTFLSKKKLSIVIESMGKEDLRFLLELVKEGKLKTVVDSRHQFEKAADAWEKSMSGHITGKVIVVM
uniref:Zinc-binding dehydrogenase n=1 Tax=Triticum urartu TaxID=4572 RepID=A0A8R7PEV9_TRIUA